MKKTLLAVMLLACLAFSLAACGTKTASSPSGAALPSAEPAASAPVPTLNAVLPGSDLSAPETSAPQEADAAPAYDEALFEAAKRCIDQDVSVLYGAIGEPEGSDYAPSCLNPGKGEDGELYYDGFTVATYREGETEIVWDVNLNEG